jgi:hypothetical protein
MPIKTHPPRVEPTPFEILLVQILVGRICADGLFCFSSEHIVQVRSARIKRRMGHQRLALYFAGK